MIRYLYPLWVLTIIFYGASGMAGDTDDILPIQLVPAVGQQSPSGRQTNEFQGQGRIQRVGKDETGKPVIVIDDRLFYLADQAKYYDANGKISSPLFFTPNKAVGYFYDAQHQLTALHLTGQ